MNKDKFQKVNEYVVHMVRSVSILCTMLILFIFSLYLYGYFYGDKKTLNYHSLYLVPFFSAYLLFQVANIFNKCNKYLWIIYLIPLFIVMLLPNVINS